MKWALILSLCFVGCTESAPPAVTGSYPGAGVGGAVDGPGGSPVVDGGADAEVDGGEPQGACDSESDLEALESDNVRDAARICGLPNVPPFCLVTGQPYDECIAECVEDRVSGLSTECATCYGKLERCGVDSLCGGQCQFDACRMPCFDCLNVAGCIGDFEDCRGLLGDGCPAPP
jgi:hypothetical protein